jgi:hypothetical protein
MLHWNGKAFTNEYFLSRGRPVPGWPQYAEIQEGLGIYGQTKYHRLGRAVKREAQKRLKPLTESLGSCPNGNGLYGHAVISLLLLVMNTNFHLEAIGVKFCIVIVAS